MTIQILKNFVSAEESDKVISFINDNLDRFAYNADRGRWMMRFGYDDELPELSIHNMDPVEDIKDLLIEIFNRTISLFDEKLYLTSWFLSKQHSGGMLKPHKDANPGIFNDQLEYTAMLYLNTLDNNGTILFPDAEIQVTPELGDLVIFNSKEDGHQVLEIKQDRYSIPMWFTKDKNFEFIL